MQDVIVNSLRAWVLAARPKTLTGAMIPVLLGGALAFRVGAFRQTDMLDGARLFSTPVVHVVLWICCLLFACLMQIAANFINDLFDYQRGADRADRLGPERACAQGWITPSAMKVGIGVVIFFACVVGLIAVIISGKYMFFHGCEYILIGLICVFFAFLYTTRFSYLGWGDALVLVFFGFVPVCGTYYMQTLTITPLSVLVALISGIAIDALLVINNYRDRNEDRISGKMTIVVRLGEKYGLYLYLAIGIVVTLLTVFLWVLLKTGSTARQPSLYLFLAVWFVYPLRHYLAWRKMKRIREGRALNAILGETSINMFLMALIMCAVLIFD